MIGEKFREGKPVILDMTEMDDAGARRLVDFAAGLAFALRGSIDKVTTKVFMLLPPDTDVGRHSRLRARTAASPAGSPQRPQVASVRHMPARALGRADRGARRLACQRLQPVER